MATQWVAIRGFILIVHKQENSVKHLDMKQLFLFFIFCVSVCQGLFCEEAGSIMTLRSNLQRARAGDYLVTAQNKNYTVLLIRSNDGKILSIEEITVPACKVSQKQFSWKEWIEHNAPGHTCWLVYTIDIASGMIQNTFSFTRNEWVSIPQSQNFLSTLLNLTFHRVPLSERKRIGPPPATEHGDNRKFWQPPLIVDGKAVAGASFDVWRTRWPQDGGDISGKLVEIYLPQSNSQYPSYFPYWLQVSGMIGKARVRIIDSGSGARSSAPQD